MEPKLRPTLRATSTDHPRDESNEKIVFEEETARPADHRMTDALYVFLILVMLAWPWIFFGVVFTKGGIRASHSFANFVTKHPQNTNYVVTLIGTVVRIAVGFLFSKAILRYSQKWVTENSQDITLFDVSLMSAFKSRNLPWGLSDRKYLAEDKRWTRVILVGACIGAFVIVPSGTTSLINPISFSSTALVTGTEINLTSTDPTCLAWINDIQISNSCTWANYHDANYTACLGEFQSFDLMESGRSNILSLDEANTLTAHFSQLGAVGGLEFLGPIRGVLPAGPGGHPAADALAPSLLSDDQNNATLLSYNLTLWQQGLSTNVSCTYDDQSPIMVTAVPGDMTDALLQFNGSCEGQADVFTDSSFVIYNSNSTLTFWACKSPPSTLQDQSYYIYLQGLNFYEAQVGNITCTVSPTQSAIFPVTYYSALDFFSVGQEKSADAFTTTAFIDQSMAALGEMLKEAQSSGSNQVVELINSLAVEAFGKGVNSQSKNYLPFYEAMLQGFMEYLATYSRMLYSTASDRPLSCNRALNGMVYYETIGWIADPVHVATLMPMTLINLASLVLMLMAIFKTRVESYQSDLTDVKTLALAKLQLSQGDASGWDDGVTYRQRELLRVDSATD